MNRSLLAIILVAALAITLPLFGQKKEDIVALQRDMAQVQQQLADMQKVQNQKLDDLSKLVQRAIDSSTQLAPTVSALQGSLQRSFTDALAKHQADTAQSLATINSKIDPLDRSVGSLQENVAQITRKFNDLNKTLDDLSSAIRLLQAPPAPPPAAVPTAAASSAAASTMYEAVYKAYSQGKEDTAMMGFIEYLKQYPQGEDAPSAQYYMGHLFDHASQYEDGVKAFQAVVDRYPDSSRASDAMYMIGVEYQKLKENAKAVAAYQAFVKQNPDHENTSKAKTRIAELRPAVATKNAKKK